MRITTFSIFKHLHSKQSGNLLHAIYDSFHIRILFLP
ncbi:MAG: hypothetical protein HFH67_12690 [Lachnospiraceae bacterium]|nr:hypothetical protein [Lachnospiraceae bacterium]